MDSILQGLQHVIFYLDNILVIGTMDEQHLRNLNTVLSRFEEHGLQLKEKCYIWQYSVEVHPQTVDTSASSQCTVNGCTVLEERTNMQRLISGSKAAAQLHSSVGALRPNTAHPSGKR